MSRRNTEQDFWNRVEIKSDDECWNWLHRIGTDGYGRITFNSKEQSAHQLAYLFTYGRSENKLHVLHECHNKFCCNPKHLKLGTNMDNARDTDKAKLTLEQVQNIKQNREIRGARLAELYKVSPSTISRIRQNRNWSNV